MQKAKSGDKVDVHYSGTLDDGTSFDSSRDGDPLTFVLGQGQVIDGFDHAVAGLGVGESVKTRIDPENAYGERSDDHVLEVLREHLPEGLDPALGDRLKLDLPDGGAVPVTVTSTDEKSITLDGNHPLAGQALTFEIELVQIHEN